ncbi:RloB family protein [Streptomyces sp. NPDC102274]|uniref:RloB family protein n=1 Tax=Streptomyces sp. NPDC102274 TaxID=3366151 RepID=UPI003817D937
MSTWGGGQQGHAGQQHGGESRDVTTPKRKKRRGSKGDEQPLVAPPPPPPDESRAVRVLYVGCEGESTEPDYLNHLTAQFGDGSGHEGQRFKIQPVYAENGLTPAQVVASVREEAKEDEAWALFDRDKHHDIPKALKDAADESTEVCFSHPSFDLWLLLHFQAFGGRQSGSSKIVVEKLRQAHPAFKNFDKRNDKSVKGERRTALGDAEVLKSAVSHAKSLVSQCEHGSCKANNAKTAVHGRDNPSKSTTAWAARSGHAHDCEVLRRDPSTDVWRLVVSLGIVPDSTRPAAGKERGYPRGHWGV